MKLGPNSKPHRGNAGYVCEMRCKLGGHIVVYDRESGFECDADQRWIVIHEPSSRHVEVRSLAHARTVMKGVAKAATVDEACRHADILPIVEDAAEHEQPVLKGKAWDEQSRAALERFQADPDDEPSPEGKAALRVAFGLDGGRS